ncbi:GntR family transcriptional regulator [Schlegelella sp. S2-27]|uniref:GntR family transcriptional regulator n=1 Tax=Caldimonas mangrovi TaxID=2944811 RepID=A0ABT0YS89_9BURK|nr:GntR family transcriptional regulator [Caldimonas mangrovi]MCM5681284.1 GntR family transcriptional regulator [Caldimonas mangrovi]
MQSPEQELGRFLEALAGEARPGDRLPPIRELMRRFGASQVLVQRAFHDLKTRGLIESQVGRGTYFRGEGRATSPDETAHGAEPLPRAAATRSVLLLRRSISIARGRVLVEGLHRRFASEGHPVLEVSYTDSEHARTVLKALPSFDACVVQSTYRTLPIDLLAPLRDKCRVLAVDGAALVGADVEAVGTEWGEPLAQAVATLQRAGHRSIAYASTAQPFLATQLGRRRFQHLRESLADVTLHDISVPLMPDERYAETLVNQLKAMADAAGRLPISALVAWGIEDGAAFRSLLADAGITVPGALSVVLLGRTDLHNEHAGFFDVVGCSVADQVEMLYQAIQERWAEPSAPYGVRFTPVRRLSGASVVPPSRR